MDGVCVKSRFCRPGRTLRVRSRAAMAAPCPAELCDRYTSAVEEGRAGAGFRAPVTAPVVRTGVMNESRTLTLVRDTDRPQAHPNRPVDAGGCRPHAAERRRRRLLPRPLWRHPRGSLVRTQSYAFSDRCRTSGAQESANQLANVLVRRLITVQGIPTPQTSSQTATCAYLGRRSQPTRPAALLPVRRLLVGATGFEPVTSSVSANHMEPLG